MITAALAADEAVTLRRRVVVLEYLLTPYVEVAETLDICPVQDNTVWRLPTSAPRHLWGEFGVKASHIAQAKALLTMTATPASEEGLRKRVAALEQALQPFVDVSQGHLTWGNREGIALWRGKWGTPGSVRVTWKHARDAVASLTPSAQLMSELPEPVED